jgi:hypothetical protein
MEEAILLTETKAPRAESESEWDPSSESDDQSDDDEAYVPQKRRTLTNAKRPRTADPDVEAADEGGEDVGELKRQLQKLKQENASLRALLAAQKPTAAARPPPAARPADAERLRRSLATSIKAQMVYKPSLKHEPCGVITSPGPSRCRPASPPRLPQQSQHTAP